MLGFRCPLPLVLCAVFSFVLLAPSCLQSQVDDEPQVPMGLQAPPLGQFANAKKYKVSGTVINSVTGEGLARAMVELNNQMATMTDANGSFEFEAVAVGMYVVNARKPGYFDRRELGMQSGEEWPATVEVGPDNHAVTVKLIPESIVFGHVTDSDGLPVSRIPVQCVRMGIVEGRREWMPVGEAMTDEDGYYRMASLKPGQYRVIAGPSRAPSLGAMAKVGNQDAGYAAAYYPAPDDSGTTAGIQIDAGRKIEADLVVRAQRFYEVSGVLMGPAGSNAVVRLVSPGNLRRHGGAMASAESGEFSLRFTPPGDYVLEAESQTEGKRWETHQPVHVATDVTDVRIVLAPAISVPVNFEVQKTQTEAAGVQGTMSINGRTVPMMPLQVILRSLSENERQYAARPLPPDYTKVAFDDLGPGKYQVTFMPMGNLYVASARFGTTDLLQDDLVITQSSAQGAMEVVVRDDGGSIHGKITSDGHPARGVVLVVPEHGAPYIGSGATGELGELSLRQLRPGSYALLAFDDVSDLEYGNPDVLQSYMSHAAHADVTANGETTVSLELIKRGNE